MTQSILIKIVLVYVNLFLYSFVYLGSVYFMPINNLGDKMVSGMSWKFIERISSQGVSFIVTIVLARLLMPEDYGTVAIINIFMSIADILLSSGLSTALIQNHNASRRDFSTLFYLNLFLSCVLYFALFVCAPFLARIYELPILTSAVRVFAIRLPISAFQTIQNAILSIKLDFKKSFFASIGGTVFSAIIGIILAYRGFGVWALIFQNISSLFINTIILSILVRWHPTLEFDLKHAKPLIKYGFNIMFSDFIGTVFNNLSDFVIGLKYTSTQLAYYSKGKQLPYLVRSNIYTTIISVLFPAMSHVHSNVYDLKSLTRKSVKMLSYIIFPIMVGIISVASNLTIVLYTEKWLPIVPFIYIVCVEAMLSVVGTVTLQSIKSYGRSDIVLKMEFIKKPIMIVSLLISLKYGVYAIALTLPFNTILEMIINGIILNKLIGYKLSSQIFDCIPALVYSLIMGVVSFAIGHLECSNIAVLVLQILGGGLVYLLLSILAKDSNFLILIKFIMNKLRFNKNLR